jgi:hypothetical protein
MSRLTKNVFTKLLMAAGLLFVVRLAHATDVAYSGTFVGTEGLATTGTNGSAIAKNFTRNYNTTGDRLSIQVVSSTYTVAVSTTFNSNNYTVNTPTITISGFSTGWTTGLAVLYSTGSVAISGLTNQTTYYLSVLSGGGTGGSSTTNPVVFKLASSLANATSGTGIVLASSSTAANNYTLAPVAFANTSGGGVQPQWSDDNSTFFNATTGNYGLAITSVTFASSGATALWDMGPIQHRYLRMKVTQPTTGAAVYTITANEKYSVTH